MAARKVIVGSRSGLHARPAAMFVAAAGAAPVPVRISTGDRAPVPAASILSVLSLGAGQGTEVTLEADGEGAQAALDALADLLARDLDAEEPETDPGTAEPAGTGSSTEASGG